MYGMTEHAAIGGECEHSTGMHLHPLYGITEFEECFQGYKEIVVTGFTNYEMPFIHTGPATSSQSIVHFALHVKNAHYCWDNRGKVSFISYWQNGEVILHSHRG